jgi:hypothetical protein
MLKNSIRIPGSREGLETILLDLYSVMLCAKMLNAKALGRLERIQ